MTVEAEQGMRYEVRKLNTVGAVVVTYTAELAEAGPEGVRLDARWTRERLALGYTTFETGDRFVEWFYRGRWYNVFEIHASEGGLKGWYCNIAAPAVIEDGVVACRDLLLDLWVAPDGATLVLDEDEFAADETLDAGTRAAAWAALAELQRLVAARAEMFGAIGDGV